MVPHNNETDLCYDKMTIHTPDDIAEVVNDFINFVNESFANKNRDNFNCPVKYSVIVSLPLPVFKPNGFYELCNIAEENARHLFPLFQEAISEYVKIKKADYISINFDIDKDKELIDAVREANWIFSEFQIAAVSAMSWSYTIYITVYDLRQYKDNEMVLTARTDSKMLENVERLRDLYIYYSNAMFQKYRKRGGAI